MSALSSTRPARGREARPRLRIAPAAARGPRTLLGWFGLFVLVVTAAFVGRLAISGMVAEGAYELHGLQQEQLQLERRETQLRAEVERLSSPQQLAGQASALGMVPGEQFLMLDPVTGRLTGQSQEGQGQAVDASLVPSGSASSSGSNGVAPDQDGGADVPSATDIDSPVTR